MKGAPELVLIVFAVVIAAAAGRKLASATSNPGFMSIDCGADEEYMDEGTGISYQSDKGFIDTGINKDVSLEYVSKDPYYGQQINNLRTFPQGTKNCYTLKPEQGKNNNYLLRAFFYYGNYDKKNQIPKFDVYIGVNYWTTVQLNSVDIIYFPEIIHLPSSDTIFVCLINTGFGVPFISALELRLLDNSTYRADSRALEKVLRYDFGTTTNTFVRYKDDVYDRLWYTLNRPNLVTISTSSYIGTNDGGNGYKPPATVLRTAVLPPINFSYFTYYMNASSDHQYYVYLHFAEIVQLPQGQKREFNIFLNGVNYLKEPITLDYLKPLSICPQNGPITSVQLYINATTGSTLPPIVNGFEVFRVLSFQQLPTDQEDVTAIMDIKKTYKITRDNWEGDPCLPSDYSWTGLTCSSDNIPRIISLNLSSSSLTGKIADSLSSLKAIQSLDLSYNDLTGPIPYFLAQLPDLKILNLTGNKLTGSIPPALSEKSKDKTLQLSLDENPNLCRTGSCEKENFKNVVIVVVCVALVLVILGALAIFWKITRKSQGVTINVFKKEWSLKSRIREFSYSDLLSITDDFKTIIGEGGFGKVHHGTLTDNTQVAVKSLSLSSSQGYKEFLAEVQMGVHHRNLVSLVGYCDEGEKKALIYEYMAKGNLRQYLLETSTTVLTWKERLQIAVDTARGLEYLHNCCKPAIVHRDMKTSNILLNDKWEAKIADFGLCKVFATESASYVSTKIKGTSGYLDPEYELTEKLTRRSDVYSFGVVLLELITGQPAKLRDPTPILLTQWVIPLFERKEIERIVDRRLQATYNINVALKAIEIAVECVKSTAIQRPDINQVHDELKECLKMQMDSETTRRI